ncbi:MAG: thioredoxin domain-containing protein, partial [Candidatus Buchananbacteria bacterium]
EQFNNPLINEIKPRHRWYLRWWAWLLWLFLVTSAGVTVYLFSQTIYYLGDIKEQVVNNTNSLAVVAKPITVDNLALRKTLEITSAPSWGNLQAKVVVVEFGDFQCPYCAQAFPVWRQMMAKYQDQVKFIWRDFPVAELHPQAVLAAQAGRCAHEQNKFWQFYDKVFINQANLSKEALKEYARQVNLDVVKFNDCLDSGKYLAAVQADLTEGAKLGIKGTPTFFFNGQLAEGVPPVETFEGIIINLLEKNK